jgi:hypothetical protein
MLQKTFRLIALFFFVSLILSPVYFKHIRHYFREINIFDVNMRNVTKQFMSDEGYKCIADDTLKMQSEERVVQIVHFSSPKCYACKDEVKNWSNLPYEIYQNIQKNGKTSYKVNITHVINESLLSEDNTKEFIQNMMTFPGENNEDLYERIKSAGISNCVATLSEEVMQEMNIEILPYSIAMKDGQVIYALAGQMSEGEIPRFAGIISKNMEG